MMNLGNLKSQGVLIGSVAAAAAVLAFSFFTVSGWGQKLYEDIQGRVKKAGEADRYANQRLEAWPKAPAMLPVPELIVKREALVAKLRDEAQRVSEEAAAKNWSGRVHATKRLPLLDKVNPGDGSWVLAEQPGLLPAIGHEDPEYFKTAYQNMYKLWTAELVSWHTKLPDELIETGGMPPAKAQLSERAKDWRDWQKREAEREAKLSGKPVPASRDAELTRLERQLIRDMVIGHGEKVKMYVRPDAFQANPWVNPEYTTALTSEQIFQGFVGAWIQGDVVNAILEVNQKCRAELGPATVAEETLDRRRDDLPPPAEDAKGRRPKNVAEAPIKMLERIAVGVPGGTAAPYGGAGAGEGQFAGRGSENKFGIPARFETAGPLFVKMNTGSMNPNAYEGGGSRGGGGSGSGTAASSIDYTKSMTGRIGSDWFDVTQVEVTVQLNPAYLQEFIAALYRQNNGYTVLGLDFTTVDPIEALTNGFIYGPAPVVRVKLTLEALFYREWTVGLMPDTLKAQLDIKDKEKEPQRRDGRPR